MTDTTNAIPEDVMEAAREAYRSLTRERDWPGQTDRLAEIDRGEWDGGLTLRVAARAIMAERDAARALLKLAGEALSRALLSTDEECDVWEWRFNARFINAEIKEAIDD